MKVVNTKSNLLRTRIEFLIPFIVSFTNEKGQVFPAIRVMKKPRATAKIHVLQNILKNPFILSL